MNKAAVGLVATALLAVALPTLIAYNVPPSATFFNQAVAFVGWGAFLLVLAAAMDSRAWPRSAASLSLLGSLAIIVVAALATAVLGIAPWSLALSSAGTVLAAILTLAMGAAVTRAGLGEGAFRAFCIALVVAGVASSAVGLVQVFAPRFPDGVWIAGSALPGRATGNLRQPNHLSSLLLWSVIAAVWLGDAARRFRAFAMPCVALFIFVIVLSASRTGALAMITLALWGIFDHRLSWRGRRLLLAAPLIYGACWWGMTEWAIHSHHLFGGETRFGGSGDISSSRFKIWSNTLSLIAMHPWLGVGWGEFNFAWTLTPFPHRPVAFFDHTHNIFLNFWVELGIPLGTLVLALMIYALWKALQNAIADGREPPAADAKGSEGPAVAAVLPFQRAAFVVVIMVAVHSMLEYPLWYAYFLLPAAFAFGLCLERPDAAAAERARRAEPNVTRPFVLASMLLVLGGTLALYDYMRVVVIFAPPADASPLARRIAAGEHSVLFAHHADYAEATIAEQPGRVIHAFDRASHFLLDARLLEAWAKALEEDGQDDKARYVAQRLREFHNAQSAEFFAPCEAAGGSAAEGASAAPVSAPGAASAQADAEPTPFQCLAPRRSYRYEDFR